ncbi:hypothetical protein WG906_04130 [Pedobacter sp. P351]|uniref:hypothetical protein n=1 Tax=Pedobacter superstes TaxID=3133441 RepID=UPI0030AACC5D
MLQVSTTDSEFNLFPAREINLAPTSALSEDDDAFYTSIKEELNQLTFDPSTQTIDRILNYSRTL